MHTKDIWEIIADIGIELHPDRVLAISDKIASLATAKEFYKISSNLGPSANKPLMNALENAWIENPQVSPSEIAVALLSASRTAFIMENREAVELVWTGPSTGSIASRHTEQVLLEVINSSRERIFIVSFVAYDIDSVKKALQLAVSRDVQIDILLESSKGHGGKVDIDSINTFKKSLPSASVYAWNSNTKPTDHWTGAVHAKCVVADSSLAFITSANLTRAAMENNMELGVLIRGGSLPYQLEKQLNALITRNIIHIV